MMRVLVLVVAVLAAGCGGSVLHARLRDACVGMTVGAPARTVDAPPGANLHKRWFVRDYDEVRILRGNEREAFLLREGAAACVLFIDDDGAGIITRVTLERLPDGGPARR
jgi:hypothetical protein